MSDGQIVVSGLAKQYRRVRAVDNLSFTVEPGRVTGFLGPNGAGKTTTLRMVLNLVTPSQTGNVNAGQALTITLTMSEPVSVTGGVPTLSLSDGANASYDSNLSNPAGGMLVFDYAVGTNDYSADLAITGVQNEATVTDAHGVAADFSWADIPLGLAVNVATVTGPDGKPWLRLSDSDD